LRVASGVLFFSFVTYAFSNIIVGGFFVAFFVQTWHEFLDDGELEEGGEI
jgi:hypothetical protein